MTASAYHLYNDLYERRNSLKSANINPEDFSYRDNLIACKGSRAKFPDMVLRTNRDNQTFTGGEFIEIKDSQSYSISSFNSTIPSAYKSTREYITKNGVLHKGMLKAGDGDPYFLEEREVYYLIRGRESNNYKICLVHGSFFETLSVTQNIKSALEKAMHEAMDDSDIDDDTSEQAIETMMNFDWKQSHLSSTRKHDDASVSIRMRVMAEVVNGANILSPKQYPDITDNTLNMVVPAHPESDYAQKEECAVRKMGSAFGVNNGGLPDDLLTKKLKHLRNGLFILFQTPL